MYGPVPPEALTVAEPLLPAKQETLVVAVITAVGEPAFVTVTEAFPVQPFASVNTTVYVPARRPVAVAAVPPDGDHAYVYGATPPLTTTFAEPLALPHVAGVNDVVALSAGGCVMVNVLVAVHPAGPEVIVQVYVPAQSPVAVAAVPPEGAHE